MKVGDIVAPKGNDGPLCYRCAYSTVFGEVVDIKPYTGSCEGHIVFVKILYAADPDENEWIKTTSVVDGVAELIIGKKGKLSIQVIDEETAKEMRKVSIKRFIHTHQKYQQALKIEYYEEVPIACKFGCTELSFNELRHYSSVLHAEGLIT